VKDFTIYEPPLPNMANDMRPPSVSVHDQVQKVRSGHDENVHNSETVTYCLGVAKRARLLVSQQILLLQTDEEE
jgi:hypothetical protein